MPYFAIAQQNATDSNNNKNSDEKVTYKLTPTYYSNSDKKDASDINLRANYGAHTSWVGFYKDQESFQQLRAGYEYTTSNDLGQWVPSIQVASQGFIGGSINNQYGDNVYSILGFGRTNMRPYYNLNFDPNDAYTFGIGTKLIPRTNLYFYSVHDNRFNTGQIISHLVWRYSVSPQERYTLDYSYKRGSQEEGEIRVTGKSLTFGYDFSNYFIKLARDQKVNFTQQDQTRFSLGFRF